MRFPLAIEGLVRADACQHALHGNTMLADAGVGTVQGTAVVGGQLLAMRISQRTVAISGGVMFLLFAANSILTSAE